MSRATDFWSRRKEAVEAEAQRDDAARNAAVAAEREAAIAEKTAGRTDAEILADLDLKDPDEMRAGDDFGAFLKAAVPERIRRRALRRLWLSDPALANLDELVDYGEDFTDAATITGVMQTAYQVGRGMLARVEEMAAPEPRPDDPDPGAEAPDVAAMAEPDIAPAPVVADPAPEPEPRADTRRAEDEEADNAPPAVKPRMRFEFAG